MEKKFDFENSFKELERIVKELEDGSLPLEEAIKRFKAGSKLARECLEKLKSIRVKVDEAIGEEKGRLKKKAFKEE